MTPAASPTTFYTIVWWVNSPSYDVTSMCDLAVLHAGVQRPAAPAPGTALLDLCARHPAGRGLHSTFLLKVSAFCGIGGALGLFWRYLAGATGHYGVFRVYFASETAQVELKSGRL